MTSNQLPVTPPLGWNPSRGLLLRGFNVRFSVVFGSVTVLSCSSESFSLRKLRQRAKELFPLNGNLVPPFR